MIIPTTKFKAILLIKRHSTIKYIDTSQNKPVQEHHKALFRQKRNKTQKAKNSPHPQI